MNVSESDAIGLYSCRAHSIKTLSFLFHGQMGRPPVVYAKAAPLLRGPSRTAVLTAISQTQLIKIDIEAEECSLVVNGVRSPLDPLPNTTADCSHTQTP